MRRVLVTVLATLVLASPASAQGPTSHASLFDRLVGHWVLRGTIDGKPTVHDVDAERVLNDGYVRLHEVSRERDAKGRPAYEAIIFISIDAKTGEYNCLWLDNTSSAGLASTTVIAHATPAGDSIPFRFPSKTGAFHNTFSYDARKDTWRWTMDDESNGTWTPFARLVLTRR